MCSLVCKIKKSKKNSPEREKNWEKNKKRMSHGLCLLLMKIKRKMLKIWKKARKNDEKTEPWWIKIHFIYKKRHLRSPNNHKQFWFLIYVSIISWEVDFFFLITWDFLEKEHHTIKITFPVYLYLKNVKN